MDTFYNLGFKGNDVLYLSERINDLGIECSHLLAARGLAFEAWEKGVLGPDRTDGLKLEWGNLEADGDLARTLRPARNLARQYSRRRPEGARRRTRRRSEELGGAHQRRHAGAARVASTAQPNAARVGRQRRHETARRGRRRTAGRFRLSGKMGAARSQSAGWLDAFAS